MVKDLWHWDYEKAPCLLSAILESAAVSFNIHLRLNWETTIVSAMLKIAYVTYNLAPRVYDN